MMYSIPLHSNPARLGPGVYSAAGLSRPVQSSDQSPGSPTLLWTGQ